MTCAVIRHHFAVLQILEDVNFVNIFQDIGDLVVKYKALFFNISEGPQEVA